jgi:transposase InsO family protein
VLSAREYAAWAQRLGLSAAAQQIIAAIRSAPPSRLVRSGAGNVPCRYPSVKMGHVVQAESHKVELPFVHAAERDPAVLEYWDQPGKVRLTYLSRSGRCVVVGHTPDYFELREDAAGWIECKPEDRLAHLAQEVPQRYRRGSDGRWTCPPGQAYAAQFGLTYRLFSSAEINWVEQRNWAFLADYLRSDCPPVAPPALAIVRAVVESAPGVTLAHLQQHVRPVATVDEINILIATARIYVDLRTYPLAEPEYVPVFPDEESAQAYAIASTRTATRELGYPPVVHVAPGMPVLWDGRPWTIGNPTETHTPLVSPQGAPVELQAAAFEAYVRMGRIVGVPSQPAAGPTEEGRALLVRASPADLARANRRYAVIKPHLEEGMPLSMCDPRVPERTKRDWARRWRAATTIYGHGYLGLLPRAGNRAHRRLLVTEAHIATLHTVLDEHYATYKNKKLSRALGPFLAACTARGLCALSPRTFYLEARRYLTDYAQRLARGGTRAAYARKGPYQEDTMTVPRHGDRPWELAHLDHTEVDLELLSARTGRPLGKAWVTILLDACTRRILALYLSYARPSYVACMMVLRLCVQRHGRLPRTIVVDGGPEFHSTYFETLLAWYKVTLKTRPPAEPRYGALCERLFGTVNTTFIHTLLGNTQVMKHARQVTPAVHPRTHARWTLGDLYTFLCEWAYEVYDTIDHPALGQSPRAAALWLESSSGARLHTRIPYDRDFIIRTLPTTRKGTARVQPGRGVQINSVLYWCSAFDDAEVEGTTVAVRYDPFDAGIAYAYLAKGGRWVECRSDYYATLQGRSERELMLIAAEVRKARRDHDAASGVTAKQLATFSARVEEHEEILLQHERDAETRGVLAVLHGRREPACPTPSDTADSLRARGAERGALPKLLPRLR